MAMRLLAIGVSEDCRVFTRKHLAVEIDLILIRPQHRSCLAPD